MNHYIIVQVDQETRKPSLFWSGTEFVGNIDDSFVYSNPEQVREQASDLQRGDYSFEVRILKVKPNIEIDE